MSSAPKPEPTAFRRFEALTRKILTTPKAELVKDKGAAAKAPKAAKHKERR